MSDQEKELLRALFPEVTEEELLRIRERFDAYAELAWEIFQEDRPKDGKKPKPEPRKSSFKPVDSIVQKFDSSQGCPGAEESK